MAQTATLLRRHSEDPRKPQDGESAQGRDAAPTGAAFMEQVPAKQHSVRASPSSAPAPKISRWTSVRAKDSQVIRPITLMGRIISPGATVQQRQPRPITGTTKMIGRDTSYDSVLQDQAEAADLLNTRGNESNV